MNTWNRRTPSAPRVPGGTAKTNYSKPCPGCSRPIVKGQRVTKVDLQDNGGWWHSTCRAATVERLLILDGYRYAGQAPSSYRRKTRRE